MQIEWLQALTKYLTSSIRYKIIVPYALLTLILTISGVFIVTRLVAGSFEDRLKNQLLEAGRVVSDEIVKRERLRVAIERIVTNTEGVTEALIRRDSEKLGELISPIIASLQDIATVDSISILDKHGKEVLRLQRETLASNASVQLYRDEDIFFGSSTN